MRRASIYENLLITAGVRAGHMDGKYIDLPTGSAGEDAVADFIALLVDEYIAKTYKNEDVSFDEFIETALMERFGKGESKHGNT